MRSERRSNPHDPDPSDPQAATLRAELPDGDPGSGAGAGTTGPSVELRATELGLIVTPSPSSGSGVPSLLPWSEMTRVTASGDADRPGWHQAHVLEIEMREDGWFGNESPFRFVAPLSEIGPFLGVVAGRREARAPTGLRIVRPMAVGGLARLRATWPRDIGDPRHGLGRRRIGPIAVGLVALVLLAGSTGTQFGASANGALPHRDDRGGNAFQAFGRHPAVNLPAATSAPAPAPPSLAGSPPLQSHEIFGYAPYWTLPQSAGFDVNDLTTLAYFSVDANADGTLNQSGPGWNGYESQDLVNLVSRSHAAGDRVVLTVTCFSQSSLDAITSDPNAPARLSSVLVAAVSAKDLDGVNFDFEGEGSADRQGMTSLISTVSKALHAANPHWQVTMATYASAAADSSGFYDVAALAPALDGFFVMAYDMNSRQVPSATAPLVGGGFNDTEALQQFTAVVPPQKVILGVPYYGYDWPTSDGTRTAQPTGGESPLSDAQILPSGHPTYWDPSTQTPWTSYQVGSQWHETFFDDPTSLALKAQLAAAFHIAGLGIWALGMDGNNPAMLAALLGNAPAVKDLQTGPTASATALAGAGIASTGVWQGTGVTLTPVFPPASFGNAQYLGTLTGFHTSDPGLACLQTGPPINVWTFSSMPGVDVVVADTSSYCAAAMWTFPTPAGQGPPPTPSSTTTTSPPPTSTSIPTTTTTSPPPTSTSTPTTTTPPSTSPINGAHRESPDSTG
ncbi:MAG: glycosyl hydrolase family 18 protein [Acidimicrobiales bacterium]